MRTMDKEHEWMALKTFDMSENKMKLLEGSLYRAQDAAAAAAAGGVEGPTGSFVLPAAGNGSQSQSVPVFVARRQIPTTTTTTTGNDAANANAKDIDKPDVNIYSSAKSRQLNMHAAFLAALEAMKTAAVYIADNPDQPYVKASRTFVTEDYEPHAFLTIGPARGQKLTWRQLSWVARSMVIACVKDDLPFEGQADVLWQGVKIGSASLKMQQS